MFLLIIATFQFRTTFKTSGGPCTSVTRAPVLFHKVFIFKFLFAIFTLGLSSLPSGLFLCGFSDHKVGHTLIHKNYKESVAVFVLLDVFACELSCPVAAEIPDHKMGICMVFLLCESLRAF